MNDKIKKLMIDIGEIDDILDSRHMFDREKAICVIKKHNVSNFAIAALNSPLNPGYTTFDKATDLMLFNNLVDIRIVLSTELAQTIRDDGHRYSMRI